MSIKNFIDKVLSEKNNKAESYSLGKLTPKEIETLKEITGFDLTDYERIIDKFGVIHTFVKHGNEKVEAARGQIAVKPEDFEKIPEIVSEPDKIESGEKNSHGKDLIKYFKNYDSTIVYVEEKRDGKKLLATQTMYKQKKKKDV